MPKKISKIMLQTVCSENKEGARYYTFVGSSFYRSTGKNSNHAGTWFPGLGIAIKIGKPSDDERNQNIIQVEQMEAWLKKISIDYFNIQGKFTKSVLKRFDSWPSLLISSQIGGGIWNTTEGKYVKKKLQEKYSNFYFYCPRICLALDDKKLDIGNASVSDLNKYIINMWLAKKASLDTKSISFDFAANFELSEKLADQYFYSFSKKNPTWIAMSLAKSPELEGEVSDNQELKQLEEELKEKKVDKKYIPTLSLFLPERKIKKKSSTEGFVAENFRLC